MSKLSKEESARYSGASWMLDKVKKDGIEAAEKELEWRGVNRIPLAATKADLRKFQDYEKRNTIATVLLMACVTLRDEYGFGRDRMDRFVKRFNEKTSCLVGDYVDWTDLQKTIEEETGLHLPLPAEFEREE